MCGIAGVHCVSGDVPRELVEEMTARLIHRGPDGDGFHFGEKVALGMRRLAIIDPEQGKQPLYNERRDVVAIFNGEIYNHLELRRWLQARGHTLNSGSDGEVLPHLYEELGIRFVERLNGIFAMALWDGRTQTLHLARDKFGVKPLYWARTPVRTYFASELKSLLRASDVSTDLDAGALDLFLTYRFIPSPHTPFEAISKLPPATILSVRGSDVTERRFWIGEMTASRRDVHELIDEYSYAFERAVVGQMMSDRPIGVMLSGGVDSAAITSVMASHSSRVRTFTIGFSEGGDANEVPLAEETARLFDTDHSSLVVDAGEYLRRLPESYLSLEEPVGTSSALAVNFVAEMMRSSVPVALCGQGADEPLGGYWRHLGIKLVSSLRPLAPAVSRVAHMPLATRSARVRRGLSSLAATNDLQLLMGAYGLIGEDLKRRLYRASFAGMISRSPDQVVERLRRNVADLDPLSQMLYVDTRLWLPDEFLLIADKMSMAASVELRVPFLDQELVALVESMDSSLKVRRLSRKWLHKKAVLKWVPRRIVYRKERGWATPMDRWLRGELRPLVDELLLGDGELCNRLFRQQELRRLIEEHAQGKADRTKELFALLSLGLWHRGFVRSTT